MAEKKDQRGDGTDTQDPRFLRALEKFRLMDDDFMAVIFDDIPSTELLLRIILGRDDLAVKEVRPHYEIKNLQGRSVCLDIFAVDKEGKAYNIEIQRKDSGATLKRARYNSSLMDAHITDPGDEYQNLAETYVIFITENDVLKKGLPLYHIERIIKETGETADDGSHIIYVNALVRDKTKLGWLMHDFFCTDPNTMHYQTLADRARYFKQSEKGVKAMCKIMEEIHDDAYHAGWVGGWAGGWAGGEEKKAKEMAVALAEKGWTDNQIAEIVKYDVDTVKKWIHDGKTVN